MKRALLAAFLMVAMVGAANAQTGLTNTFSNMQGITTATGQVSVLTTVIQRLVVTPGNAIDFGFVTAPASGTAAYSPLQSGTFTVTGQPGATISLTQGAGTTTTLTGGTGTVTFAPGTPSGSTTLTGGTSAISVGGTLTVNSGATGDFSGTYQLDVAYVSI